MKFLMSREGRVLFYFYGRSKKRSLSYRLRQELCLFDILLVNRPLFIITAFLLDKIYDYYAL